MIHILLDKVVYNTEGIGIRCSVKIKGAAQKMMQAIADKELFCRGRISADIKKNTMHAQWRADQRVFDGTGFVRVLISHFIRIFPEFIEVPVNIFITNIYSRIKPWKVNVYPKRIFGPVAEKGSVPLDTSISGIFKRIREFRTIKTLIFMGWEIYPEITPGLWRIGAVAGNNETRK